jgi:hypothetical protein
MAAPPMVMAKHCRGSRGLGLAITNGQSAKGYDNRGPGADDRGPLTPHITDIPWNISYRCVYPG